MRQDAHVLTKPSPNKCLSECLGGMVQRALGMCLLQPADARGRLLRGYGRWARAA